jgi:hypothetical protein
MTAAPRIARIVWIDDEFSRESSRSNATLQLLKANPQLRIEPYHPLRFTKDIAERHSAPDLFLVDYRLSQEPLDGEIYSGAGTSVAGLIRDLYPEHPIYLTSALLTHDHAGSQPELFERAVTRTLLTKGEGAALLVNDALTYRKVRATRDRQSPAPLCKLLATPALAKQDVLRTLPDDLKHGLGELVTGDVGQITYELGGTLRFGRWVTRIFLQQPGILYDDLYTATHLGMSQRYLSEVFLRKHKPAAVGIYAGIFASTYERRWWKALLGAYVLQQPGADKHDIVRPWELGPIVFKVPANARAKCVVCKQAYPETVAYDRDNPARRGAAHLRCSEPSVDKQPTLHFEHVRTLIDE